jgi:hypothetical protein
MIRVLSFLWSGCWHEWKELHATEYDGIFMHGQVTVCRCAKCKARKVVWGLPKGDSHD